MPSWKEATAVQKLDTKTYSCNLHEDWCIGSVPNGGYVTGCVLEVVSAHFSTTLAKQNQPHTIALHIEFLRRTQSGPAIFKVETVKVGRQTSVVHVHMSQDGREEVIAYVTNSNMDTEDGVGFDTGFKLYPPIPPVNLSKLERNEDTNWFHEVNMPFSNFRKATKRVEWYFPRNGNPQPNMAVQWMCFSDGTNFTDSSIGFAADMFPQIAAAYPGQGQGPFWYPTLLLNLDIKKKLPPEGVKWLSVHVQTKNAKKGRMDLDVHVFDAEGDLVALSNHVSFIVDAARNLATRKKPDTKM